MSKTKRPALAGVAEVRAWLWDVAKGGRYPAIYRMTGSRLTYATNGYSIALSPARDADALPGGPAKLSLLSNLAVPRKLYRVRFETLRRFAATNKRKQEPVRLFGVCVDRVLLNRLLRKAPAVRTATVGIGSQWCDSVRIKSERWELHIMPIMNDPKGPSFSRTVSK